MEARFTPAALLDCVLRIAVVAVLLLDLSIFGIGYAVSGALGGGDPDKGWGDAFTIVYILVAAISLLALIWLHTRRWAWLIAASVAGFFPAVIISKILFD